MTQNSKIVNISLYASLALLLSYLENFLLLHYLIPIPGFKIGLGNIAILISLLQLGMKEAFFVGFIKNLLLSLVFTNPSMLIFSIISSFISIFVMDLTRRTKFFSAVGISINGAVCFNLSQLMVYYFLTQNKNIFNFTAFLILLGACTGLFTGWLVLFVNKRIEKNQ